MNLQPAGSPVSKTQASCPTRHCSITCCKMQLDTSPSPCLFNSIEAGCFFWIYMCGRTRARTHTHTKWACYTYMPPPIGAWHHNIHAFQNIGSLKSTCPLPLSFFAGNRNPNTANYDTWSIPMMIKTIKTIRTIKIKEQGCKRKKSRISLISPQDEDTIWLLRSEMSLTHRFNRFNILWAGDYWSNSFLECSPARTQALARVPLFRLA